MPPKRYYLEIEDDTASGSREAQELSSDEDQMASHLLLSSLPSKPQTQSKKKQRIWSPHGEATVLVAMIEYEMNTGKNHVADIEGFTKFANSKLRLRLYPMQLKIQIMRIKRKFRRRYLKVKDKTFSDEQKQRVFNLSRDILGEEINEARKGKEKAEEVEDVVGGEKRAKIEEKLNKWKLLGKKWHKFFKKMKGLRKSLKTDMMCSKKTT